MSLEETQRKREMTRVQVTPPGGVSRSSHKLGIPVLGSSSEEANPGAGWRTAGAKGRTGEAWTLLVRCVQGWLALETRQREV